MLQLRSKDVSNIHNSIHNNTMCNVWTIMNICMLMVAKLSHYMRKHMQTRQWHNSSKCKSNGNTDNVLYVRSNDLLRHDWMLHHIFAYDVNGLNMCQGCFLPTMIGLAVGELTTNAHAYVYCKHQCHQHIMLPKACPHTGCFIGWPCRCGKYYAIIRCESGNEEWGKFAQNVSLASLVPLPLRNEEGSGCTSIPELYRRNAICGLGGGSLLV